MEKIELGSSSTFYTPSHPTTSLWSFHTAAMNSHWHLHFALSLWQRIIDEYFFFLDLQYQLWNEGCHLGFAIAPCKHSVECLDKKRGLIALPCDCFHWLLVRFFSNCWMRRYGSCIINSSMGGKKIGLWANLWSGNCWWRNFYWQFWLFKQEILSFCFLSHTVLFCFNHILHICSGLPMSSPTITCFLMREDILKYNVLVYLWHID